MLASCCWLFTTSLDPFVYFHLCCLGCYLGFQFDILMISRPLSSRLVISTCLSWLMLTAGCWLFIISLETFAYSHTCCFRCWCMFPICYFHDFTTTPGPLVHFHLPVLVYVDSLAWSLPSSSCLCACLARLVSCLASCWRTMYGALPTWSVKLF